MNDFVFELNSDGIRELLRSSGVGDACREKAEKIKRRIGSDDGLSAYVGRNRVNVSVSGDPDSLLAALK